MGPTAPTELTEPRATRASRVQGLKGDKGDQGIQGAKGDQGIQGIQGVAGPAGVSGVEIVSTTSASSSNDKSITATCPAGKTVVGGGASVSLTDGSLAVVQSTPGPLTAGKATTWVAAAGEIGNVGPSWTVTAFAVCATG